MKIIFENKNLAVIDKPAGILTHPTLSKERNTVVDFIIKKWSQIKKYKWSDKTRPGIVHRLDKDTSGLLLIAKNPQTQEFLQDQFCSRKIQKNYSALVLGKVVPKQGIVKTQISRDQKNRTAQKTAYFTYSWQKQKAKFAETFYEVIKYYKLNNNYFTSLELKPKTGRMHQLRIHCQHLGYPIIGDQKYNTKESRKISRELGLMRQFLHAHKLTFALENGILKTVKSQLPDDLENILTKINI